MAALTPSNIVQTSSDLSSFDISSLAGKQKIPSMYLLNELSASLSKQLNNLSNILNLNEIKWLGQSSVHPSTGKVVIDGIEYKNEDIDPGNYVTYNVPGTSSTVKYIYGHGIWTNIGDVVNLPDGWIYNQHVNQNAQIQPNKIAGLSLSDLRNDECTQDDVKNLSTTLKAMIADYKKFDINTIFNSISGQVNNSISVAINGNTQDLTLSFTNMFKDIAGDVYNTITTSVDTVIGELNFNFKEKFENIDKVINNNSVSIQSINADIANVKTTFNGQIENVDSLVQTNKSSIESLIAQVANIDTTIQNSINGIIKSAEFNNNISNNVSATVANLTSDIANTIQDSVIETLAITSTIDSRISSTSADVKNNILNTISGSYITNATLCSVISNEINSEHATVIDTIGTTFNNCNIGSLVSPDDSMYASISSYTMRYCGEFRDWDAVKTEITKVKTFDKVYTIPTYDTSASAITTSEVTTTLSINFIDKGSVVRIGNDSSGWELYLCTYVPDNRDFNEMKWIPFVDDKKYIKRSCIQVVSQLPADSALIDGMFYVVVDE